VERSTEEINGHVTRILHLLLNQHSFRDRSNGQRPEPSAGPTTYDILAASPAPAHQQPSMRIRHSLPPATADLLPLAVLDPSQLGPNLFPPATSALAAPFSASISAKSLEQMESIQPEQHPES
jgi:hypothetical protein